jgi:hypothetical protein
VFGEIVFLIKQPKYFRLVIPFELINLSNSFRNLEQ